VPSRTVADHRVAIKIVDIMNMNTTAASIPRMSLESRLRNRRYRAQGKTMRCMPYRTPTKHNEMAAGGEIEGVSVNMAALGLPEF
jgi:hypothetical protein